MLKIAYKQDENGKFDLKLYEIAIWEKITKEGFSASGFMRHNGYDIRIRQRNNTIEITIHNQEREDLPLDGVTVFKGSIPANEDDFFDNEFFKAKHIYMEDFICKLNKLVKVMNANSYKKDPEFLKGYEDIKNIRYKFPVGCQKRVQCDNCGATFHERKYIEG